LDPDIYYKKTLTYKYGGKELQFRVSQDLFSSFQVDIGTQFLIRTVTLGRPFPYRKILDLGCGYGAIGITLKQLYPETEIHMVDRDALAIEYSRQNTELNHLSAIEVYGSLGYENLMAKDYDLVISNIPAKAGETVIKSWLNDAVNYLQPDGQVVIVIVKTLEISVRNLLVENLNAEILLEKTRPGHTVFIYKFKKYGKDIMPAKGNIYSRGVKIFSEGELTYRIEGAFGLEEYEELNYATTILLEELIDLPHINVHNCLVINPGVGHVPVVLYKLFIPAAIVLRDRDLLSLKYAKNNLILNGCREDKITSIHQVGYTGNSGVKMDLITGFLREEEGVAPTESAVNQLASTLNSSGIIILAGSSTGITRVAESLSHNVSLKEVNRRRYRGFSAVRWQHD